MSNEATKSAVTRGALLTGGLFAIAVGALWAFPTFWYSNAATKTEFIWFGETRNVAGWQFKEIPISESAEASLATDHTVNGQFVSDDSMMLVRGFSAKRYSEAENGISLLMHTPDQCWTSAGWKLELAQPLYVDLSLHGVAIRFERRLFVAGGQKELVYFGALFGGKPLTYRLDQYLAWGSTKPQEEGALRHLGSRLRDLKLWGMAWNSFLNRTAWRGSQQFIRISTPVRGEPGEIHGTHFTGQSTGLAEADERLRSFLPQWLVKVDYEQEYGEWRTAKAVAR